MVDNDNKGKLDRILVVKFFDYLIDRLVSSFSTKDEIGTITKNELFIPLKVESNSTRLTHKEIC